MHMTVDLSNWIGSSGPTFQGLLLGGGILLLFVGSRHYKVALVLPAAILGATLIHTVLGPAIPQSVELLAIVVGAVGSGILAALLEAVAVRLAGVLLGGGFSLALWPAVVGAGPQVPWWVPLAGALVGLALFPRLYKAGLRVVVPLLGGLVVSHAIGRPGHLGWVLGLAAAGFALDTAVLARRTRLYSTEITPRNGGAGL
jgi:hypothetical protein